MSESSVSRRLRSYAALFGRLGKKNMIKCEKCRIEKDESDFTLLKTTGGYCSRAICLACRKARLERRAITKENAKHSMADWKARNSDKIKHNMAEYRAKNRQKLNRNQILKRFNLTEEQYAFLIDRQNGCCAICDNKAPLAVDHCHATDKIRGLLCGPCNRAIGLLKENPHAIERALDYCLSGGIL